MVHSWASKNSTTSSVIHPAGNPWHSTTRALCSVGSSGLTWNFRSLPPPPCGKGYLVACPRQQLAPCPSISPWFHLAACSSGFGSPMFSRGFLNRHEHTPGSTFPSQCLGTRAHCSLGPFGLVSAWHFQCVRLQVDMEPKRAPPPPRTLPPQEKKNGFLQTHCFSGSMSTELDLPWPMGCKSQEHPQPISSDSAWFDPESKQCN